jgi:hypothetical protein
MDCRSGAVGGGVRLGGNDELVPEGFCVGEEAVLEQGPDAQPSKQLAELIQSVADEWEEAHRRYIAKGESSCREITSMIPSRFGVEPRPGLPRFSS